MMPLAIVPAALFMAAAMQPAGGQTNGPARAPAVAAAPTNAGERIWLQFEDADIRTILIYLSDLTGERILPDKSVKGNVTLIAPEPMTKEQAIQCIYSMLEAGGYTLVRMKDVTKVIASGEAVGQPIPLVVPGNAKPSSSTR
ncbi:hypothetical protein GX586_14100 [bacterium]|nr:hypothetical protein [bacterium]